jgi:hypothetical protein
VRHTSDHIQDLFASKQAGTPPLEDSLFLDHSELWVWPATTRLYRTSAFPDRHPNPKENI